MTAEACAARLHRAHVEAVPCDRIDDLQPTGDPAGGYAVQACLARQSASAGRRAVGWKVGVTSPGAMALFGTVEPIAGIIYADSIVADGGALDLARCCQPKIEGELLLRIGHVPTVDANDVDLLASIAAIHPALEIAESRIAGWPDDLGQAIADNACCGHLVIGPGCAVRVDLATVVMTLRRGGEIVVEGRGSDCLGSPLAVYRWLLGFARDRGWPVAAGDIVLTGAMGRPIDGASGGVFEAELSGVGVVAVRIAAS